MDQNRAKMVLKYQLCSVLERYLGPYVSFGYPIPWSSTADSLISLGEMRPALSDNGDVVGQEFVIRIEEL